MAQRVPIGARLRAARLAGSLTLEQVAATVGISQGFLSRLERDQVSPSVATLVVLCETIGLPIGGLFEAPSTQVVRAGDGAPINFGGDGASETLLTPGSQPELRVIHAVIEPNGSAGAELYALDCEVEFAYVITGALIVIVGLEQFDLGAGDSMTFRGTDPHRWFNGSDTDPCEVLWVMAPAP